MSEEVIDYDCETSGFQPEYHRTFLMQFGDEIGNAVALRPGVDDEEIQRWFNRAKAGKIRAWNGKFDRAFGEAAGFDLPGDGHWIDGMIGAHALDERRSVALKAVGDSLGFSEGADLQKNVKGWLTEERRRRAKEAKDNGTELTEPNYSDVPNELMIPYALEDIHLTRKICAHQDPLVARQPDVAEVVRFEHEVFDALYAVERRGMPVDFEGYKRLELEVIENLERMDDKLNALALVGVAPEDLDDFEFNPRSSQQILAALKRRGADLQFVTNDSMDAENLETVEDVLAAAILDFRSEYKILTTYVRPMTQRHYQTSTRSWVEPYISSDGRVHTTYRQLGARTGRMSSANPNCVTLDTEILTRRGWLAHDEVRVGDETVGYKDGVNVWTPITAVHHYTNRKVVRLGHTHWSADVTPDHRWLTDRRGANRMRQEEMCATSRLTSEHRLLAAAPLSAPSRSGVTEDECRIIAWAYTDGTIYRGRGKRDHSDRFEVRIFQAKPTQVAGIRVLLADVPHSEYKRKSRPTTEYNSRHEWVFEFTLRTAYARELWARAGLADDDLEGFVRSLGAQQLKAFMEAAFDAEGSYERGYRVVAQSPGNVSDALMLGVFLLGHRASRITRKTGLHITRYCKPTIGGTRLVQTVLPEQNVWCVTTEAGTWTMRQNESIQLTGNCQNQPRDDLRLRFNFHADPGMKLVTCDLNSVEMAVFAAYAGEGRLLDAVRNGTDIHAMTAEFIGIGDRKRAGGHIESARQRAKVFNFSIVYGGGIKTIRKQQRVNQAEARLMLRRYHDAYPEVARLQAKIEWALDDRGYIKSAWGRRFRMDPRDAYKGVNYLVQGTAADILKVALIRCHKQGIPVVGCVHDELIAHVPESDAEEVRHLMIEALTDHPRMTEKVPLTADGDIVDRWSAAKDPTFSPKWAK